MKKREFTRAQVERYFEEHFSNLPDLTIIKHVELLPEALYPTWVITYTIEEANPSMYSSRPFRSHVLIEQRSRKTWPSGQKEYYLIPVTGIELPQDCTSVRQENELIQPKRSQEEEFDEGAWREGREGLDIE